MDDDFDTLAEAYAKAAKAAARELRVAPASLREAAIRAIADQLEAQAPSIEAQNTLDLEEGARNGLSGAILDRLKLDRKRIGSMAKGLRDIASQTDPLGRTLENRIREDGLGISRVSVPLGVVFFIYESRPNVTTDAAALCLRSGNAIILRGGKEAIHSNRILGRIIADAVASAGLPGNRCSS